MFIFTIALFSIVLSLSMETECFVQPTNKPSHFLDPHSQIPFASSRSSWTQLAFFSNWNSLSIEKTNTTDATANVKDVDQSSFDNYIKLGFSPKITDVHDFNDFLSTIKDDERLCVVKFYADWCKSCHKFGVKYKKLALTHGDKIDRKGKINCGQVNFAEIEFGENRELCRSLGIKKLPYVLIYKGNMGLIDQFSCGPKFFDEKVVKRLNNYMSMSDEEIAFEKKMNEGQSLIDEFSSKLWTNDVAQKLD